MTQLTYEEAFDPYHTVFRLFRLREILGTDNTYPIDKIRILDFLLLFPYQIAETRLKRADRAFRTIANSYAHLKPYAEQPDKVTLFARMEPIQHAAIETLVTGDYISSKAYKRGKLKFTQKNPPEEIERPTQKRNAEEQELLKVLDTLAREYPLIGSDGLKARTQLMEHRYDAA